MKWALWAQGFRELLRVMEASLSLTDEEQGLLMLHRVEISAYRYFRVTRNLN
jgi:hypothetical protein